MRAVSLLALRAAAPVFGDLLSHLKSAAHAAAAVLRPIDRVGLFAFSDRVRLAVEPPATASALAPKLETLQANGDTVLIDATFAALAVRARLPGADPGLQRRQRHLQLAASARCACDGAA